MKNYKKLIDDFIFENRPICSMCNKQVRIFSFDVNHAYKAIDFYAECCGYSEVKSIDKITFDYIWKKLRPGIAFIERGKINNLKEVPE